MFALLLTFSFGGDLEEEKYGVKYASTCEVCKVLILFFCFVFDIEFLFPISFKCDCNGFFEKCDERLWR